MTRKPLSLFLIAGSSFFLMTAPAAAYDNYYNPGKAAAEKTQAVQDASDLKTVPETDGRAVPARTVTVTSIQKCYEQLSREDALEIQRNYMKPYQECQRRLTLKLKSDQSRTVGELKKAAPAKPANFYRVQKTPSKPAGEEGDAPPAKPRVFVGKIVPLN